MLNVVSGPASLEGNTLTLTGRGTVTLKATQAGDAHFGEADEVIMKFCVLPAKPVITLNGIELQSSESEGNEWYKDGVAISGAIYQSFHVLEKGEYRVKVTGTCGESRFSDIYKVTVAGTTADLAAQLKIYPNPAAEDITLNIPLGMIIQRFTLYNSQGTLVNQMEPYDKGSEWVISTKDLAKGIYILKIDTSRGPIIKKVCKI
jgi:hypothetical protein